MSETPPCPRCSFPYEPGAAERYWEARWRDEKASNDALVKALEQIADGTRDEVYPLRAMGRDQMRETARDALRAVVGSPTGERT